MFSLRRKQKISVKTFRNISVTRKEEIIVLWCNHDFAPFYRWRDSSFAMRISACLKFLWYSQTLDVFCRRWNDVCRKREGVFIIRWWFMNLPRYIIWYVWKYTLFIFLLVSWVLFQEKKYKLYIYTHRGRGILLSFFLFCPPPLVIVAYTARVYLFFCSLL